MVTGENIRVIKFRDKVTSAAASSSRDTPEQLSLSKIIRDPVDRFYRAPCDDRLEGNSVALRG